MELNHNLNSNDKVFIFKIATLIDRHTTKDYRGGAAGQNFQSPRVGLVILILAVRPSEGRYCICPSAVTSRHFLKSWTRIFRHLGNIQAVGKCDSYQISLPDQTFLSEWVNLKFFNFFWPGSLSYMVLNWIRCGFFFLGGERALSLTVQVTHPIYMWSKAQYALGTGGGDFLGGRLTIICESAK